MLLAAPSRALLLGLLMLGALASGCAEGDEDPCHHRLCNIDELACVERVANTVACQLDADEIVVPVVRFLTVDEVLAELEAQSEEPTPELVRDVTDYFRGEALVGLMPETYEYGDEQTNFVDWAIAYYSYETKEVVVITDNVGSDPERAYAVLVHEIVHAYQDDRRDIEALYGTHATSVDRSLGVRAIIEGEAEHYESLAAIDLLGLEPDSVDWDYYFHEFQTYVFDLARESEEPSLDVFGLFPYAFGSRFVFDADQADGHDGIDAVFDLPPDSARQVMLGHGAWPDRYGNDDERLDLHAVPVLPESYEYLGGGHQSVWLLNAMLQRTASHSERWVTLVLADVSADYLGVFRNASRDELVAVWRIQSSAPTNLLDGLLHPLGSSWTDDPTTPSSHLIAREGDDVVLVATSGPDAALVLAEIEGWQSPDELFARSAGPQARARPRPVHEGLFPTR